MVAYGKCKCGLSPFAFLADMGWQDWVVQPEGFEMAVCSGTCPGRDKVGPNHIRQKGKVSGSLATRQHGVPAAYNQSCVQKYDHYHLNTYLTNSVVISGNPL